MEGYAEVAEETSQRPGAADIKEAASGAASDLKRTFVQLMITAFALAAGLAWSEAIQSLFAKRGPLYAITGSGKGNAGLWWAAVGITVIAFLATTLLAKLSPHTDAADLQKAAGAIRVK
jgi:hypothetical protein